MVWSGLVCKTLQMYYFALAFGGFDSAVWHVVLQTTKAFFCLVCYAHVWMIPETRVGTFSGLVLGLPVGHGFDVCMFVMFYFTYYYSDAAPSWAGMCLGMPTIKNND